MSSPRTIFRRIKTPIVAFPQNHQRASGPHNVARGPGSLAAATPRPRVHIQTLHPLSQLSRRSRGQVENTNGLNMLLKASLKHLKCICVVYGDLRGRMQVLRRYSRWRLPHFAHFLILLSSHKATNYVVCTLTQAPNEPSFCLGYSALQDGREFRMNCQDGNIDVMML